MAVDTLYNKYCTLCKNNFYIAQKVLYPRQKYFVGDKGKCCTLPKIKVYFVQDYFALCTKKCMLHCTKTL